MNTAKSPTAARIKKALKMTVKIQKAAVITSRINHQFPTAAKTRKAQMFPIAAEVNIEI